jgi:hypothetical protein
MRYLVWLVAAVATYFLVSHLARGADGLNGQGRAAFINSAVSTCLPREKAAPENAGFSEDFLVSFCNCKASEMANSISPQELRSFGGSITPALVAKAEAAVENCTKRLITRCQRVGEALQCQ